MVLTRGVRKHRGLSPPPPFSKQLDFLKPRSPVSEPIPKPTPENTHALVECIQQMISLGTLKRHVIEREVGLPFKYIMDKLGDSTLDHIHLRKLKKHITELSTGIMSVDPPAPMSQPPPVHVTPPVQVPPPAADSHHRASPTQTNSQPQFNPSMPAASPRPLPPKRPRVLLQCPILKMGYVGVECHSGNIPKSQLVEHLATHVATLMKRVNELENRLDLAHKGGVVQVE